MTQDSSVYPESSCASTPGGAFQLSLSGEGELKVSTLWGTGGGAGEGGGRGRGGEKRYPSPLVHDGLLYTANTNGVLEVLEMKTGTSVYRQRLPVRQVYSSLAMAGGLIYDAYASYAWLFVGAFALGIGAWASVAGEEGATAAVHAAIQSRPKTTGHRCIS